MVFVTTPQLEADLGIGHATAMLALFTAPAAVAGLGDPLVFLTAERRPRWRKAMVVGGLVAQGGALLAAALSTDALALGAAMSVLYVASSASTGLAEATLIDSAGDAHEQWMARWAGLGAIGDLLAPLLVAAVAWLGLGWRAGVGLVGLALWAHAATLLPHPFPAHPDAHKTPSLRDGLREAWSHPDLSWWLLGASLCALLDEIFVAMAALHLDAHFGASEAMRGLLLAGLTGGTVAGLFLAERALARGVAPMRLLRRACLACTVCFAAWWLAPTEALSALTLLALGLCIGPLWPIAMAQAFRALPERSTLVEVAALPFGLLELALPLVLGVAADTLGLRAALLLLLAQPIGLWLISRRRPASPRPPEDR